MSNILRKYIKTIIAESPLDYFEMMGLEPLTDKILAVNDEIESRHPAHAFPNSEHVEGSIGHVLDLISLKKKYGRSRSEHETQAILDKWRGRMGAGSGKGMAAWTAVLTGGGLIAADMVFLGGAFTAMGVSGAGLNVIHEVMAGNAVDDDLKEYIQWDPEILKWMDDKKEDELEDEWIDLLFEHISKNPKDNLATFISINDFANKKLGRPLTGEKIQIRTNELRKYIRGLLEAQYGGPGVQQSIGYGKNYHTVNPQPNTWKDYAGLSYDISAEGDGSYYASVQVLDYPELSTSTRSFSDEGSAEWWVRDVYEKFHRFLLSQSPGE